MLALGFLAAPAGAAVFAFMPKSASAACVAEYTWNGTTTFNISIQQKLYAYQDPTCSGARSVNYAWGASGGIEFDELTWSIWRSWACGSILDNGGTSYGYNVIARYTGPGQHGFLQSWCTPQADQNAHWRDVPYQIDVWHYFNV
jgi:hypothetical protein